VTKGETSSTSRAIVYIDPHADVIKSEKTEKLIDYVVNCESRRVKYVAQRFNNQRDNGAALCLLYKLIRRYYLSSSFRLSSNGEKL
jgi:hypothetical protein